MMLQNKVIWGAPSLWIERVPVLLANRLKLWSKYGGLSFDAVELKVNNGGQETLETKQTFEIGEIGIFPFVAYNQNNRYQIIGSSFIKQLDHYIVYKTDIAKISKVGILSHGSCDSFLIDQVMTHPKFKGKFNQNGVEKIELKSEYGNAAMMEKNDFIDAMFLVEPYLSKALMQNEQKLDILCCLSELYPKFQWNALFASTEILKNNPSKIKKMMSVYKKSVELMMEFEKNQNVKKCLDEIAKFDLNVKSEHLFQGLQRGMARYEYDYTQFDEEGVKCCLDMMQRVGFKVPKDYKLNLHIV